MGASLPIILSEEFNTILKTLEGSSDHFFITGKAGTGKSTLLHLFRNTTRKKTAVLAPTGIAALNVKGQTIHSFFGFPPRLLTDKDISIRRNRRLYQQVEVIIIDEISMVRADMIDNIDKFLRKNRGKNIPFGGVQMIFFGDLFQLPPVVATPIEKMMFRTTYESPYFFSSNIMKSPEFDVHMIELHRVYRQDSRYFIRILDNIRLDTIDEDDLYALNERNVDIQDDDDYTITLCSINRTAKQINETALHALEHPVKIYQARITGSFSKGSYPTDPHLALKRQAQVMFVKNDPQRRFVNGTIGIIESLSENEITVRIQKDSYEEKIIKLEKEEWEILKYKIDEKNPSKINHDVIGTFEQYPIKLAWAITIHKSQGKTFDKVVIDLGRGAFEYGQTYVALSRCRTLQGIYLRQPLRPRDILVDDRVREYYQYMRYHS